MQNGERRALRVYRSWKRVEPRRSPHHFETSHPFATVILVKDDGGGLVPPSFRLVPVSAVYAFSRLGDAEHAQLSTEDQLKVCESEGEGGRGRLA